MQDRPWWLATALSGALMVMAGAFGAHALEGSLAPRLVAAFETGVRYQAWHTLALLAVLAWRTRMPLAGQGVAMGLWVAGMLLFSGSLYALVLTGLRGLGLITPIGGVLLVGGWLALVACVLRSPGPPP